MRKNKKKDEKLTFFNGTWIEEEILGAGSYGTVYKAKKSALTVTTYSAIKRIEIPHDTAEVNTLKSEGLTDKEITGYYDDVVKKWVEEIEFMADFKDSSTIVNIEDYEIIEKPKKSGYIIHIRMELLENIDSYILNNKVTDKTILKMAIDICQALEDCEKNDVLHRDIKPDNVFVNSKGVFKLGDFGIAKKVSGTLSNLSKRGTENYMAPEMYKGEKGNRTVDIYSLGIMLYRYFNFNRLPYLPDYPEKIGFDDRENALMMRILGNKMNPPKNASRDIAEIILKACNYYPKDRYQSAKEMKNDLLEVYEGITKENILFNKETIVAPKEVSKVVEKTNHDETINVFSTNVKFKEQNDNPEIKISKVEFSDSNEILVNVDKDNELNEKVLIKEKKTNDKKKNKKEEVKFKNKKKIIIILGIIIGFLLILLLIFRFIFNNKVEVPNVVGKKIDDVSLILLERNLKYKVKNVVSEDGKKIGVVLEQSVSPNKKVEKGTVIVLKVMVSKVKVKVPSVVGMSKEDALEKLKKLGLTGVVKEVENSNVEKGKVISQNLVDVEVYVASSVEIEVSLGKEEKESGSNQVKVPSNWSNWVTALPGNVSSSNYYIEEKKQYRYSNKEITTNASSSLDGWTLSGEDYTYSDWSSNKTKRGSQKESDVLRVIKTRTVYRYYSYINVYANGGNNYNVDSIAYGSSSKYCWYDSYDNPLSGPIYHPDQGNKDNVAYVGPANDCSLGFTIWYYINSEPEVTYQTRTKTMIYNFSRWGNWSNWQDSVVLASDNKKVETRTLYRYKKK